MRLFDISRPLGPHTPVYPGDPVPEMVRLSPPGWPVVSRLTLTTHTGTHLDVPAHLIRRGRTVDEIPLEWLIGPAQVVECGEPVIRPGDLAGRVRADVGRLLLKTTVGPDPGTAFLMPETADWLVDQGYRLVGIDSLSVDPVGSSGLPAHERLLGAGVLILEGLDLSGVPAGVYLLVALPLKVAGGDGAPVRAVLVAGWPGAV